MIPITHRWPSAVLACLLALSTSLALATAQQPDVIVIDEVSHPLNTNPLEPYLATLSERPKGLEARSTALWRGYVATWTLQAGKLWLQALGAEHHEKIGKQYQRREIDLWDVVFPDSPAPVAADWYTGALIIPDGKLVEYVHMGYGSTHERYIVIIIRNGNEKERFGLSTDEFRDFREHRFQRFRATEAYRRMFDDMASRSREGDESSISREEIDGFIRDFASEQYLSADSADDEMEKQ